MEAMLVDCVRNSLSHFVYKNAIFMCERLCAEFPSEVNLQLLATSYLQNNQAYSAYHLLKGTQMAQSRYLFALSCYQMDLLNEAESSLCPVNEPGAEIPNGAAGHYLLGLIYKFVSSPSLFAVFAFAGVNARGTSGATSYKTPTEKSQATSHLNQGNVAIKVNHKCKLMDIGERKQVVAEGRVHSRDPNQMVHFVRLGPNAARVWVDVVMVEDAEVWRKSDEIESLKDAHGLSIAWPIDKLVIF